MSISIKTFPTGTMRATGMKLVPGDEHKGGQGSNNYARRLEDIDSGLYP